MYELKRKTQHKHTFRWYGEVKIHKEYEKDRFIYWQNRTKQTINIIKLEIRTSNSTMYPQRCLALLHPILANKKNRNRDRQRTTTTKILTYKKRKRH